MQEFDPERETVDELRDYYLRILQPLNGYRFSLDPLLLANFAALEGASSIIDLGTGSGILSLVLARKKECAAVVGVELQEELADLARRSASINGLGARVEILCEDIHSLRRRYPVSSFDLIVSNPPYRKPGTGRISPRAGRDAARHESTASLSDFLATAKYLVKPSGRICFIYHPSRLTDFIVEAESQNLAPLRLQMVHGTMGAEARMFMIELAKGRKGDLRVLNPLIVHRNG